VELEEEDVRLDDNSREDAEYGVDYTGMHGT
jgi:hypothetical protein